MTLAIEVWPQIAQPRQSWRDGMFCHICGTAITRVQPWNLDHVQPLARGGRKGKINKAPAHVLCNSVKGDKHPFSLRTEADRDAVREWLKPSTYRKLLRVLSGE